jgi:hypothetical protein
MNDKGRKLIAKWIQALEDIKGEMETMAEEEQEKFDNLSEGLQQAESGQMIEAAAATLNDMLTMLENVISELGELA